MGIRPDLSKEHFDEIMNIANKNCQIPVRNFDDAIEIVLSLIARRSKAV